MSFRSTRLSRAPAALVCGPLVGRVVALALRLLLLLWPLPPGAAQRLARRREGSAIGTGA